MVVELLETHRAADLSGESPWTVLHGVLRWIPAGWRDHQTLLVLYWPRVNCKVWTIPVKYATNRVEQTFLFVDTVHHSFRIASRSFFVSVSERHGHRIFWGAIFIFGRFGESLNGFWPLQNRHEPTPQNKVELQKIQGGQVLFVHVCSILESTWSHCRGGSTNWLPGESSLQWLRHAMA